MHNTFRNAILMPYEDEHVYVCGMIRWPAHSVPGHGKMYDDATGLISFLGKSCLLTCISLFKATPSHTLVSGHILGEKSMRAGG